LNYVAGLSGGPGLNDNFAIFLQAEKMMKFKIPKFKHGSRGNDADS